MIHNGIDRLKALRLARRLGCEVATVRRQGEVRVRHPLMSAPCTANNRRKDASRHLVRWLRRLQLTPGPTHHRPPTFFAGS